MTILARWLRCTEGQAYTLVVGLLVATLLAIGGIPAVLRDHPANIPATNPTTFTTDGTQRGATTP